MLKQRELKYKNDVITIERELDQDSFRARRKERRVSQVGQQRANETIHIAIWTCI